MNIHGGGFRPGAGEGRPGIVLVLTKYDFEPEEGSSQKSGGYFQAPDLVFDLKLSANEKLVLIYFMRRADRDGMSFPSVDRICRDCGFGSKNTALKAIRNLVDAGLIRKKPVPGRSHNYYVSKELYRVIKDAKARYEKRRIASSSARNDGSGEIASPAVSNDDAAGYQSLRGSAVRDRGNLMKKRDGFAAPFQTMTNVSGRMKKTSSTRSEYEHPCSNNEPPGVQNMNPKEYTVEPGTEKEYTVNKEARKKKKSALEEAPASSSLTSPADDKVDDNKVTLLDVAEHMHALSPGERRDFDRRALSFRKPGEPDPDENLWQKRLLRVRYLQRLRDGGV